MKLKSISSIIRINGKKIDVKQLEKDIVKCLDGVKCALVVKLLSERNKKVILYVQLPQGEEISIDVLINQVKDAEIVEEIIPLSALPLDMAGNVDKNALEQLKVIDYNTIKEAGFNNDNMLILYAENYKYNEPIHIKDIVLKKASDANSGMEQKHIKETSHSLPKPAYVNGGEIIEVEGDVNTLSEMLLRAAEQHPDKGIINIDSESKEIFISYQQLEEEARKVLGGLQKKGIKKGDKVILLFDSNEMYYYALWGCILGGIIPAPMTAPKNFSKKNNEIKALISVWETVEQPVILSTEYLIENISSQGEDLDFLDIAELMDTDKLGRVMKVESEQTAILMFTSGSTGKPKGVIQTHMNISNKMRAAVQFSGYNKEDVLLNWLSIEHVVGLIAFHVMPIYLGANQVHIATDYILEEPLRWMDLITKYRSTITWAPNSLFALINDSIESETQYAWKLDTIKRMINAGEAVNNETCRKFLYNLMPYGLNKLSIKPEWGMSETCCMTIASDKFCANTKEGIQNLNKNHLKQKIIFCDENSLEKIIFVECGYIYPGLEMRIIDNESNVLNEGEIGRFQVRGKMVLPGYYNNPEVNAASFTEDGWFDTGDLAFIKNQSVTFTGRMKDIIIVNGINYQNIDIETCVEEIENIDVTFTAACAIKVNGEYTDSVVVFYVPLESSKKALKRQIGKIKEYIFSTMGLKVKYVLPVERSDIPKTNIGKIQRSQLVKRFEEGIYNEKIKELDILLDNEEVLKPWFFTKEYVRSEIDKLGEIKGKHIIITGEKSLAEYAKKTYEQEDAICRIITDDTEELEVDYSAADFVIDFRGCQNETCYRDCIHKVSSVLKKRNNKCSKLKYYIVLEQNSKNGFIDGFVKSLNQEENNVKVTAIRSDNTQRDYLVQQIMREMQGKEEEAVICYKAGKRYIESLTNMDIKSKMQTESRVRYGGRYIITGGTGGIGTIIAKELIDKFQAELLIVGRTAYEELDNKRKQAFMKLLQMNSKTAYLDADISTEEGMERLRKDLDTRWNTNFDGIFHLAGVGTFSGNYDSEKHFCRRETEQAYEEAFAPKVTGTYHLSKLLKKNTLFVCFGSVNGYFGGVGYSAYSGANSFMSLYVEELVKQGYNRCYCMNWSAWNDIGMSKNSMFVNAIMEKGFLPLLGSQAVYSMFALLRTDISNSYIGLDISNYNISKKMRRKESLELIATLFCNQENEECAQNLRNANLVNNFIIVNKFPLNKKGNLDKKLLYNMAQDRDEDELIELETDTEKRLAGIWKDILQVNRLGKNSDFFAMGGHSLNATKLISYIKNEFHVKIPLNEVFQNSMLKRLAVRIDKELAEGISEVPIINTVEKEYYKLSYAQNRVFMLETIEKQRGLYNIVNAWDIQGELQLPKISEAIQILVQRHQMLRTTFKVIDGEPVQIVHDDMQIPFAIVNTEGLPKMMQEEKIEELIQNECNREFDLFHGPLMICTIIKKNQNNIIFIIAQHHIISDGWSFGVLVTELEQIYQSLVHGEKIQLQSLPVQITNYIEWSNEMVSKNQKDKLFWLDKLGEGLETLDLPTDFERPDIQTYNGDTLTREITGEQKRKVEQFNKTYSSTMFLTMLSAYYLFLYKLTGQKDIVVGVPVAGREDSITKDLIGMFVNSLAIRNEIQENVTRTDFFKQIRDSMMEAYEHQNYPFDRVVDDINPVRDISRTPIFQTMFNYLSIPLKLHVDGAEVEEHIVRHKIAKYDMSVNILDLEDRINISLEYNTDLFSQEAIENWFKYYFHILNQVIENAEDNIIDLDLLTEEEKEQMLSWNNNQTEYPRNKSICDLFREIVQQYGDHKALIYKEKSMSYRELDQKSDAFACELIRNGVQKGDMVGIYAERNMETIIGVLAIIKCGASYVPINKKYTDEVIKHMLDDCAISVIVSNYDKATLLGRINLNLQSTYKSGSYECYCSSNDNAYVIYTSGTTGIPKGVVVSHRNIVRLVKNTDWITFQKDDVLLQTGALSFDASTFEIWGALLNGLSLCLVDNDCILDTQKLKQEVECNRVTIMWVSAPLFNQLIESDASVFQNCRTLLVGGDILSPKHINKVRQECNGIKIINGYGPTENTTFSTTFCIDRNYESVIPIGKPISNSSTYVVNNCNQLQPYGVIGELLVGGDGVAKGYLNQKSLTKQKFIDNPFVPGEKIYRTGDYVKMDREGNLHFCGRIDNQVKVRGFRIELDAIKNVLISHEAVKDAMVLVDQVEKNKSIVAYIVVHSNVKAEIQEYLKKHLQDYMMPSRIIEIDKIPLNTNGKVDIARLKVMQDKSKQQDHLKKELPRNKTEKQILQVFQKVLQNQEFSVADSFFEFGGDSLLTIKVSARLKDMGYRIDPKMIFLYPDVRELTKEIQIQKEPSARIRSPKDYLVKIHNGDSQKPNIIFAPPAGGTILGYIELARHFVNTGMAYGVQAPGLYDDEQPQYLNFNEMVDFCIRSIEDTYRPGVDYLSGHSLGGHFAYAMCYKLMQKNKLPKGLVILDTAPSLNAIDTNVEQDISEEEFKLFVLTMGIGNMLNEDVSRFENMTYEQVKAEIVEMSKSDETIASFLNEQYLDKYLKIQLHHILLSREVILPKEKLDVPITIIRTTEHEQYVKDLFLEWQEYSSQEITILDFKANHTSMMKLPHVTKLAKQIEDVINK